MHMKKELPPQLFCFLNFKPYLRIRRSGIRPVQLL